MGGGTVTGQQYVVVTLPIIGESNKMKYLFAFLFFFPLVSYIA